jgi:hypothetical protein
MSQIAQQKAVASKTVASKAIGLLSVVNHSLK